MQSTTATRTDLERSVDASELRRLLERESDIGVLDVRSAGEYDSIYMAGSYNAPLDTLVGHACEFARLDHPIVLVCKTGRRAEQRTVVLCRSGGRSGQAAELLDAAGFTDVVNLDGGMLAHDRSGEA